MSDSLLKAVRLRLSPLLSRTRFGQFASVGLIGATVDNLALIALVELTVLGPVGGKVGAWIFAIAVIFVINEHWTFSGYGSSDPRAIGRRLARSYGVRFAGFLVTISVLSILVYGFDVWYLLANLVGLAAGFVLNYTFESLYTWKVHHDGR